MVVDLIDEGYEPAIRLLRGMAPMFGLMQIRGIRMIVVAWLQTLPATFTVFVPVFFIIIMFAIVGQDVFGGRLKRCVCLNDWETSVAGLERCPDYETPAASTASNGTAAGSFDGSAAPEFVAADVITGIVGK